MSEKYGAHISDEDWEVICQEDENYNYSGNMHLASGSETDNDVHVSASESGEQLPLVSPAVDPYDFEDIYC